MNIEELITHTNIIIEEGLDSEDDIQSILKKWKTAYEKEKEKNEKLQQIIIINEKLYNRETKRLGNIISELLEE